MILWATSADLPGLPDEVLALREAGLEIATVRDLRSYKKLIPALRAFPGHAIVTADDDVYYPPDWLTGLAGTALEHPGAIVALRCHMARVDAAGALLPYRSWEHDTSATVPRHDRDRLCPTGSAACCTRPAPCRGRFTTSACS